MKEGIILWVCAFILLSILSWGFNCFIIWGICKLVGWTFSFKIATAIWLCLCLVSGAVKNYR